MVAFAQPSRNPSFFFPKVTLNHGRPVPAVLLANKSDHLASQQPKLDSFCRENGFVGWFETSAKVHVTNRWQWPLLFEQVKPQGKKFWAPWSYCVKIIWHTRDFYASVGQNNIKVEFTSRWNECLCDGKGVWLGAIDYLAQWNNSKAELHCKSKRFRTIPAGVSVADTKSWRTLFEKLRNVCSVVWILPLFSLSSHREPV